MKILLDHPCPFLLAHGGFQIQIEQTLAALNTIGLHTEYLQWWNPNQSADIIHYFGRPDIHYLHQAHQKGYKIILAELLTGLGSRPAWARKVQKAVIGASQTVLPPAATRRFGWQSFKSADACVANTKWEAHLMHDVFGTPENKIHVIPNGVEDAFFAGQPAPRGEWLVCTATVTGRKRVLELAQAAVIAQTPVWIIGKPYAEADPYARRFCELAALNPAIIRYQGGISDRAQLADIYRSARGFVLLSTMETRSLSAEEAAASGCPLLLSDLPWARSTFGSNATYVPVSPPENTAGHLKKFYAAAPSLPAPPRPLTWAEVARQLETVYEKVLSASS
jgi:glycosyltransferase involved in cell wall biosynthesis